MKREENGKRTLRFDLNASDLEARGRLKRLGYLPSEHVIKLDDMLLIEDDAPAIGAPKGAEDRSWFEKLHRGVMIRKDLVLDDPRAFSGYLVFNGSEMEENEHPLHIRVNGTHLVRLPTKWAHPFARQYYTREWGHDGFDNWFVVEIPVGALRQGKNEFVLWTESEEASWEIMVAAEEEYARGSVTRVHHPNRSSRSRDGGATWDFDRLGWKDAHDGEYAIRLSLDRYVPEGTYVSPVIDLAEAWGATSIKKRTALRECSARWIVDVPEGTRVKIRARLGENPVPSSNSWSPFREIDGFAKRWENPPGRYLQFNVVMGTENPLVTPALKGLSVESALEGSPSKSPVFHRIVEFRNRPVVRPSVEFTHEDFLKLKALRERFELDAVVEGASTEFERQLRLMRWAYKVPIGRLDPYAWNYYDLPLLETDADSVREEHSARRRDGHCLYCNLTLIAACLAMGYPARWTNISTKSTYGHEVTEVWSNDFDKWVFMDATRDYYIYDPDTGVPMNLLEISERLREIMPRPATWDDPVQWQIPDNSRACDVRVAYREGDNAYSIRDVAEGPYLLLMKGHLQMPTRNDFASRSHPVPWRVSSNWGGDLFYCYYSETFPRKREYQLHTNRPQDFTPPLNRSELFASETERPGVLRVDMDTETPCFETFLVRIDDGEWREHAASSLEWALHEGLNRLQARIRNTVGVCGPESFLSVVMNR